MPSDDKPRRSKIAEKTLAMRNTLWPNLDEASLWNLKTSHGWLEVPRPMPLLLKIMDNLSKGKPVSSTYLDLWCRTYRDSYVVVNRSREMAFFAGFTGERAEHTWTRRMRLLQKLGFIDIKDGSYGPISAVLIKNPYVVVKQHYDKGNVDTRSFNALTQRMIEIGAADLEVANTSAAQAEPERRRRTVAPARTERTKAAQ